jgi:hypothetical protein
MDSGAAIQRFVATCRDYCAWVEANRQEGGQDVAMASRRIAAAFSAALELPEPDADTIPHFDVPEVLPEWIERAKVRFGEFPAGYYRVVFHALDLDSDSVVVGDLVDDFLDIYCDLKGGLEAYDRGEHALAVWHWRLMFGHWGRHATGAMHALNDFDAGST